MPTEHSAPNLSPIPSFPAIPSAAHPPSLKALKLTQRQSEFNFFNHILNHPSTPDPHRTTDPPKSERPSTQLRASTLRLVDPPQSDQASIFSLPYPNPDLSLTTNQTTTPHKLDHPPYDQQRSRLDDQHPLQPILQESPFMDHHSTFPTRTLTPFKPHPTPSSHRLTNIIDPPPPQPLSAKKSLTTHSTHNLNRCQSPPFQNPLLLPFTDQNQPADRSNCSPAHHARSPFKPIQPSSTSTPRSPTPDQLESPKKPSRSFIKSHTPSDHPPPSPQKSTDPSTRSSRSPRKSTASQVKSTTSPRKSIVSPKKPIDSPPRSSVDSPNKSLHSTNKANQSPIRQGFLSPSAAISSIIKSNDDGHPQVSSSAIDQVMNELETRTKQGPRITRIAFQDQIKLLPGQASATTTNRFAEAHGKQFAKYDSITNHYAAKRKNEGIINGRSVTNPLNKRAKVSDLGFPKQVESQQENEIIDSELAQRQRQNSKRQLELARSRRKSNNQKHSKPTPSGFSSFGTRLIKSAVKTVTGAFKSTQSSTTKTDGVGFGVPAGLGVGPAKVPPSPTRKNVQPTRSIVKAPLNRLPPAGLHRVTSTTLSDPTNRRRVVSGPPTSSATAHHPTKVNQTQSHSNGNETSVTVSKSNWQPKTILKPAVTMSRSKPNSNMAINQSCKNNDSTKPIMRSRIPKISTHNGQTIIRPTLKTITEATSGTSSDAPTIIPPSAITTTTTTTTSKIIAGIGQSNKSLPKKLSQPIRSTQPMKRTISTAGTVTTTTNNSQTKNDLGISSKRKFASSTFVGGGKVKSSLNSRILQKQNKIGTGNKSLSSSISLIRIKKNQSIDNKSRKSSLSNNSNNNRRSRRKSSLSVGTKAISHRVS